MPKATSKIDLLNQIESEHVKLEKTLSEVNDDQMNIPGACGEWAVKDILTHLFDWECRFRTWYAAGLRGEKPKTPDENFNWRELPALNHQIYLKHHARSLDDIRAEFARSYTLTLDILRNLPEDQLFAPGLYSWLGKWSLAQYATSATSSHYRWARTEIRKWLKGVNHG